MIKWRGSADVIVKQLFEFGLKRGIVLRLLVLVGQLVESPRQRFWDVATAKVAEAAGRAVPEKPPGAKADKADAYPGPAHQRQHDADDDQTRGRSDANKAANLFRRYGYEDSRRRARQQQDKEYGENDVHLPPSFLPPPDPVSFPERGICSSSRRSPRPPRAWIA